MKRFLPTLLLVAALAGTWSAAGGSSVAGLPRAGEDEVRAVLDVQAAAWNRGDVESFMQGYWRSEQLTFAGANGVTRGWQGVLERYRRNYPDRKAMGRLSFSEIEITALGADAALVLGHWQLERETDRPGGVFTLVARRTPQGWRIIHDHTSSAAPPKTPN